MSRGPVTPREPRPVCPSVHPGPVCPSVHPAVLSTGVLLRLAPRRVSGFLTYVHQKRKGAAGCPSVPSVSPDRRRPCEPCAARRCWLSRSAPPVGDGVACPESCALSGRGQTPRQHRFPWREGRERGDRTPTDPVPHARPHSPSGELLGDVLGNRGAQSGKGRHTPRGVLSRDTGWHRGPSAALRLSRRRRCD